MDVSPIILNTMPFDADLGCDLHYTYNGSQIYGYKILIYDNITNTLVETIESDQQANTILDAVAKVPAGLLFNSNAYNFELYVKVKTRRTEKKTNPETNEEYEVIVEELAYSAPSPRVALRCFKTPVFSFSNLKNKDVIYSSWFEVGVSYYQEKNEELLDTWSMTLQAGAQKAFVWSSGTKLASTKSVRISDLVDNGEYYLQATCKTVSGLMISTPLTQFSCNYEEPDLFLSFNAENMPDDGVVYLSSDFVSIEGYSDAVDLTYVSGDKVQLLNGERVHFEEFAVEDFVCNIIVSDVPSFATITNFQLVNAMVSISWNWGNFIGYDVPMFYAELTAKQMVGGQEFNYIIQSNKIEALRPNQQVIIYFKHLDGMFDVRIQAVPEGSAYSLREGGVN